MAQKFQRAVILSSANTPLAVQDAPIPVPGPGSAIVRILATPILAFMSEVLSGKRPYPMSFPLTPGTIAIGRVTAIGPDTTSLTPNTLVLCDILVSARDDRSARFLMGLHSGSPKSRLLMDGEWRHSTWAEYAKFPLENIYPLDESLLLEKHGYSIRDLCTLPTALVPFGGLDEIGLRAGETIVIAPATGQYGGAAVRAALAMGAIVIAMGRNRNILERLFTTFGSTGRLTTVPMTGTLEGDTSALRAASPAGLSALLDISPPAAAGNTYLPAALSLLKHGGRVALMGGVEGAVNLPYDAIVYNDLKLCGKWMYSKQQVERCIQMAETGILALGERGGVVTKGEYGLEEIEVAVKRAAEESGWGAQVVVEPAIGMRK